MLVERVEGFCSEADRTRARDEINDVEHSLIEHGIVVAKFRLVVGKDEPFRRFKAREEVALERFKITDEDWRDREQRGAYETAARGMVDRTSSAAAPWTLVEANNKYHARIKVLRTLCEAVESALKRPAPKAPGKGARPRLSRA